MRIPRMTTRRWFVVVAIAAVLLATELMRERWSRYRLKARMHGLQAEVNKGTVFQSTGTAAGTYAYAVANPEWAAYHAEMQRKYESAALRPWLAIEPDPAPP